MFKVLLWFCEAGAPTPRQWHTTYSGPETVISLVFILDSASLMCNGFWGQYALRGLQVAFFFPFFAHILILHIMLLCCTHELSFLSACMHTKDHSNRGKSIAYICHFPFKSCAIIQQTLHLRLHQTQTPTLQHFIHHHNAFIKITTPSDHNPSSHTFAINSCNERPTTSITNRHTTTAMLHYHCHCSSAITTDIHHLPLETILCYKLMTS